MTYDVTKEQTFHNAKRWMEELRANAEPDIVIMLVGNKIDLAEKNPTMRKVQSDMARRFAESNNLYFEETSAVTTTKVKEAFENLLQEIYNQQSTAKSKNLR